IAEAACFENSGVRVRATISFAARVTSSVNSPVRKIGVSEIRKSAGHFSVSFTQRRSAAYFSGEKSALNRARSAASTMPSPLRLVAVLLLDDSVDMERPEDGDGAFVVSDDYAITTRSD